MYEPIPLYEFNYFLKDGLIYYENKYLNQIEEKNNILYFSLNYQDVAETEIRYLMWNLINNKLSIFTLDNNNIYIDKNNFFNLINKYIISDNKDFESIKHIYNENLLKNYNEFLIEKIKEFHLKITSKLNKLFNNNSLEKN